MKIKQKYKQIITLILLILLATGLFAFASFIKPKPKLNTGDKNITSKQAKELVANFPQVQAEIETQPDKHFNVMADAKLFDAESNDPYWIVRVYSDANDQTWYKVFQKSSKTQNLDNFTAQSLQLIIGESDLAGTSWIPKDESDMLIRFQSSKLNDPYHKHYDYQIAADARLQEEGFWHMENGRIFVSPTTVYATPQKIQMFVPNGKDLLMYISGLPATVPLIRYNLE